VATKKWVRAYKLGNPLQYRGLLFFALSTPLTIAELAGKLAVSLIQGKTPNHVTCFTVLRFMRRRLYFHPKF
jgi:hypothetical protein